MALTRAELKLLIKEVLVEILNEGLGNVSPTPKLPLAGRAPLSGAVREARAGGKRQPDFDPRLDTPVGGKKPNNQLKEAIRATAGNDPIMASILRDTASTTLPLLAADRNLGRVDEEMAGGKPGIQQVEQIVGTPEEVFGEETAGRWADLAFMDGPGKKSA